MTEFHTILDRAEDYRARRGWSEATLGLAVSNNARLMGRFRRRLEQLERDAERIAAVVDADFPASRDAA